jgi:hypothetical protein
MTKTGPSYSRVAVDDNGIPILSDVAEEVIPTMSDPDFTAEHISDLVSSVSASLLSDLERRMARLLDEQVGQAYANAIRQSKSSLQTTLRGELASELPERLLELIGRSKTGG